MPSKYCDRLPRCKNAWWCAIDYRPGENAKCFDAMTNADRIRSMTDEELADELLTAFAAFYEVEWSKDAVLDWLKQEAT